MFVEMFEQHREEAKWAKATGSEGQREVHTCLKRRRVIKCEHEGAGFTDFHRVKKMLGLVRLLCYDCLGHQAVR